MKRTLTTLTLIFLFLLCGSCAANKSSIESDISGFSWEMGQNAVKEVAENKHNMEFINESDELMEKHFSDGKHQIFYNYTKEYMNNSFTSFVTFTFSQQDTLEEILYLYELSDNNFDEKTWDDFSQSIVEQTTTIYGTPDEQIDSFGNGIERVATWTTDETIVNFMQMDDTISIIYSIN